MADALLKSRNKGLVFVVSAPAGTGKTTLVRRLIQEFPSVIQSISYTTRLPRETEIPGRDYHFISKEEFEQKIVSGDFLEYVKLYDTYYGTSLAWIREKQTTGKHIVLVIDTEGALQLKKCLPFVSIFLYPPSIEVLQYRLKQRQSETPEMMQQRLDWANIEFDRAKHYDYHIINDNLETAYQILRSIFIAESHKNLKDE